MGGDDADGGIQKRRIRDAQKRRGELVGKRLTSGDAGEQLIQNGERIARGTAPGPDDGGEHGILHLHALAGAHVLQQPAHDRRGEQAKRVMLDAGADGADDFLRLRGGEDEHEMLRGLLHNLQQRVGALLGDHVRLVDDEDAVA